MENIIQENVQLRSIVSKQNNTIEKLETENTELKATITEVRIAAAKKERDGVLKEANLPEPCVNRLHEAFAKSTDNAGLKSAIKVELRGLGRAW
jgi:hypothetical protein